MKKLMIALMAAGLLLSCSKEEVSATVVKNCTGTYLDIDGQINRVCNFESLEDYDAGVEIQVKFDKVNSCSRYDTMIVCEMYFPYDHDIEVSSVE